MGSSLTKQGFLAAQVTEALKIGIDERNIGGVYNAMNLMEFSRIA